MCRHNYSIRRRTTLAQKLPADFDDRLFEYKRFIINLRKRHAYPLSAIGNADQTPMTFDNPFPTAICPIGTKSVLLRTTGNEKCRFTVMLGAMADGTKFLRESYFQKKHFPLAFTFVSIQKVGWMSDSL